MLVLDLPPRADAVVERRVEQPELLGGVRAEHDRSSTTAKRCDPVDALRLEVLIADRERLVDDQDLGIDAHREREREPQIHARRVRPHRLVDEVAELGERDHLLEERVGVGQGKEGGIHARVVAAGELGMEPGAELQNRGHATAHVEPAGRGRRRAGQEREQRRFSRAVLADHADRFARRDRQVDIAQRPELLVQRSPQQPLARAVQWSRVHAERLAELLGGDDSCRLHRDQTRSESSPRARVKIVAPRPKTATLTVASQSSRAPSGTTPWSNTSR